ncbi:MAG TPA: DUF6318 family protein [Cellulomonas sp.]|uniref:DUF6318 family protein n=1 Tax=Cellulomonas sp. TaxID=40001 RepID=UPI002E32D05D|nr:DUF6318 family protein [Cellulomonas sp.]HEX5331943.1 DUF6318 family protein [Cellulomonas sp.]
MPRTLPVPDAVSLRPVGVASAAILAVGLLGGCSFGGSEPVAVSTSPATTVAAPPTPTAAVTPSPTATPKPERPAAMDTVNLDGAIATATYFLSLYPYVYNTGDLSDWKALAHPECVFCASVVANVEKMHALGHHQVGADMAVTSAVGVEVTAGSWFSVDIDAVQAPWVELESAGGVVDHKSSEVPFVIHLIVVRDGETWSVRAGEVDVASE